ncbi:hypothetical protein CW751_03465 [Brumimicrobium salinarum]|uniref:Multipass membrane protein n=1 Tax=Brumimicrobium salinarum TaxID=2058658 RepID=A0A2I0R4T9_9FLAO|nr:hypothetical protein [Brumimicrobium salinarum]PKR81596.1 hypothetical protein CW751_03465 [Brumimicrobium salinarum]
MNYSYFFKYWITILLVSPVLLFTYSLLSSDKIDITFQLEAFSIFLIFSILFALPTVIISIGFFYFLNKKEIKTSFIKAIIITVTVLGTFLTLFLISSDIAFEYSVFYSIIAILSGAVYTLR